MTRKKSGKEEVIVKAYAKATPGTVIKDFGHYRVVVDHSTVKEMDCRMVYAVINNDTGIIEEECSVLPQALLHAGQFNKEMTNDHWMERLNPTGMMVPTAAQMIQKGPQGRSH